MMISITFWNEKSLWTIRLWMFKFRVSREVIHRLNHKQPTLNPFSAMVEGARTIVKTLVCVFPRINPTNKINDRMLITSISRALLEFGYDLLLYATCRHSLIGLMRRRQENFGDYWLFPFGKTLLFLIILNRNSSLETRKPWEITKKSLKNTRLAPKFPLRGFSDLSITRGG